MENILCGSWTFRLTSDNFLCVCVTFRQLSVCLQDIPSTFCVSAGLSVNLRELYMQPRNLPSTFRATAGPSVTSINICTFSRTSVNIPCDRGTFRYLQSTFWVVAGVSAKFRQLCLSPQDLPSTFVKYPWFHRNFFQHFLHSWDLPSTSVDLPCICRAYHKLASTYREAARPPANFPYVRCSVNIPCVRRTCQLRSTSLYYSVVQAVQQRFLPRTHEIFFYDSCYFHYSVVRAVRLCWTSLN